MGARWSCCALRVEVKPLTSCAHPMASRCEYRRGCSSLTLSSACRKIPYRALQRSYALHRYLRESSSAEDVMKQMTLILERAATSDGDALVTSEIRERVLDLMAALLAAALRAQREVANECPSSER